MRRILKDLVLTQYTDRGSLGGQYPTVEGRELLAHGIMLDLASTPGELTHRPDYGAGIELSLGLVATPNNLAAISRAARRAALNQPGVTDARAVVQRQEVSSTSTTGGSRSSRDTVVVRLEVELANQADPERLAFALDVP